MNVSITEWGLNTYLELLHKRTFSRTEYKTIIRPNAELLKKYPNDTKFQNSKFWGLAKYKGNVLQDGFKMKWHNIGNGNVQLRLAVAIIGGVSYLCKGYVKANPKVDSREMANFKIHIHDIYSGNFKHRGYL